MFHRIAFSIALVALVNIVAPGAVSSAWASCSGADRIPHKQAECLHVWWKSRPLWVDLGAYRTNKCPASNLPTVVKWDLKSHGDYTWYLSKPEQKRRKRTAARVRSAYCCADLGLCNLSQLTDNKRCSRAFDKSYASSLCDDSGRYISYSNGKCSIRAKCRAANGAGQYINHKRLIRTSRRIEELPDLQVCGTNSGIGIGPPKYWFSTRPYCKRFNPLG